MWLLYLIGFGLLLYALFRTDHSDNGQNVISTSDQLEQRNVEWAQFIAGYHKVAKTKAEKKLVERMLQDLGKQGLPVPILGDMEAAPVETPQLSANSQAIVAERTAVSAATETLAIHEPLPELAPKQSVQVQLDNTSLLLYFGAFLFVASIGLFVAFGGLPGTLRTLAVALIAAVMYGGGIWLFRNKPKLEQAGLAFAGIGLAAAPFVGLAAYNFVFDQSSGATVWFLTSVGCMALYLHALVTLKKPLLNYVLIFTLLSLVESGVSIISAPLYYFGWGLSATGLLLTFMSRFTRWGTEFQDASNSSARLLMPLASITALFMAFSEGSMQLGVSLTITAAYYVNEFWYGRKQDQVENAVAGQVAAIGAVNALSYAVWHDVSAMAASLLVFGILQAAVIVVRAHPASTIWQNFGTLAAATGIEAVLLSYNSPTLLTVAVVTLVAISLVIWQVLSRIDGYVLGAIAWMGLPVVIGQVLLDPRLEMTQQTGLLLASLLVEWAVLLFAHPRSDEAWRPAAKIMYALSAAAVVWASLFASPAAGIAVCAVIAVSMILLAEYGHDLDWSAGAGVVVSVPVLVSYTEHNLFLFEVVLALLVNIFIALRYRQELTRWLSTILWFLVPVALGNGPLGQWTASGFAWAYVVVMAGLIFSRLIARGKVLLSTKVPLASYAKTASISYVVGYTAAAVIAVLTSLGGNDSQLHTTLILGVLSGVTWYLATTVEQRADLFTLLPLLAQAILLSALRIPTSSRSFDLYLLLSTVIAAFGYIIFLETQHTAKEKQAMYSALRDGSLTAAVFTPLSFMFAGETKLMMPIGLLVFTGLLYHRMRATGQSNREWIGALGLISVWWLMWFAGVRNTQAYTHVLAALFAAYAYLRHLRGETSTSDQYLIAMLATATVPLILQALGGVSGDLYGWWLLLEQVFFMLLGMSIGKSFVTRWGLYVAVGAVLYQLRHLGWAALTVLAIFIIGLAMYRLQKLEDKK